MFGFGFGSKKDINAYVLEARTKEGVVLLDVRGRDEFQRAHIAGALNIPLAELASVQDIIPDLSTPIYAFCLSGARSARAVKELTAMGYTDAINIGGMNCWTGPVSKGVE